MTDADRTRWDERYATRGPASAAAVGPPAVFAPYEDLFPTEGSALDLACGQGINAVWLARRGLDVWALDVSPVAVTQARDLARQSMVADHCRFDVVDLDKGLPAGRRVDVILCQKFRDGRLDQAIVERLVRGGLLAITALSVVGVSPGPFRVAPGELTGAFAELEHIAAGEADGEAWLFARR